MPNLNNITKIIIVSLLTSLVCVALTVGGLWYFAKRSGVVWEALVHPESNQSKAGFSESSIPDVVATAVPAVVSVVISADVPVIERYYDSFDPFGFFGQSFNIPRQRQVGTEKKEIGGGTGFFVSSDGYLVTNKHVVDTDGAEYSVVTNDGTSYPARVVAKDPSFDVAVLKVDSATSTFPFLTFAPGEVRLGEGVIAIGNALAEFPNSVSVGVVSGLSRDIEAAGGAHGPESLEGLIQTDAAINHGNSGGPLLNLAGEVVGVNVAVADGSENIGFSLPATLVSSVYDSVAKNGKIVRPFLGVRYLQIDADIAKANNLSTDYGVIVLPGQNRGELAVQPGSPADKAGLVENDIILAVAGTKLDGEESLSALLRKFSPGDKVKLTILHDGNEKEIEVTLGEAPDNL